MTVKTFQSKRNGKCTHCEKPMPEGMIICYIEGKAGYFCCEECAEAHGQQKIDAGQPAKDDNILALEHLNSAVRALTMSIGRLVDAHDKRNELLAKEMGR